MAHSLTVRVADAGDREAWLVLWKGWQAHMGGSVPEDVTARSWAKLVAPASGIDCLMAFKEEVAVGFAIASRSFFAWTGEDIFYLQDLYVAPEARGRGVGSALLSGLYARQARRTPYLRYMRHWWPW